MIEHLLLSKKFGGISQFPESLGDSKETGLALKPLTVFIGQQGTGKSLFSQIIYFFRNLSFLVKYQQAGLSPGEEVSDEWLIRLALDNLRSRRRAMGVFADPSATLSWPLPDGTKYSVSFNKNNRQVYPNKALLNAVRNIRTDKIITKPLGQALFIPAERVIYSHANPNIWQLLPLPSTLTTFAAAVDRAGDLLDNWQGGAPCTEQGKKIRSLGQKALAGEIDRRGGTWKWRFGKKELLDIDMASSGQKANWPVVFLSQALFDWRKEGLIGEPFYIHIEEPEIHLHPTAQRSMMELLAYLVNQGFHVLITTHSLTVLYTLNNLISAPQLLPDQLHDPRVPDPDIWLSPEKVAAYLFDEDGKIHSIIKPHDTSVEEDKEKLIFWLDEDKLRLVDEELGQELSRMRSYGVFWEAQEDAIP